MPKERSSVLNEYDLTFLGAVLDPESLDSLAIQNT